MNSSLALGLAMVLAAPGAKDPPKKEMPTIVGQWSMETAKAAGMEIPFPKEYTIDFGTDGRAVAKKAANAEPDPATYTVDTKKSPNEIDLKESRDRTMLGIYKIEGDMLTICFAAMGGRPDKFESPAGSMNIVMILKRVKK
jgi:uncharacterized protein (TIGR03067 family)